MSDSNRAMQAEQLIARMQAARGYIYPEWELAARMDPDFTEAYNRIYELALGEGRHVSAKVREFVAIALLAFRARTATAWWPICVGPYASVPPRRNCLKSLKLPWFPAAPRRSIAG